MQSKSIGYIEKLDHVRFLAAVMVLMFHLELLTKPRTSEWIPIFHEGHSGVQLFMVISGFILAMIAYGRG
jgi:peptidoglycan/LPS O-acetylase OafA/YrhL